VHFPTPHTSGASLLDMGHIECVLDLVVTLLEHYSHAFVHKPTTGIEKLVFRGNMLKCKLGKPMRSKRGTGLYVA
jgi:hypothetical protein